jgi:histidine triad (HIT) family protein
MTNADCLFCRIVAGEIPATIVLSNTDAVVIRDVKPQAPVHVLVIPRAHFQDATDLARKDQGLFGRLMATAVDAADQESLTGSGYRLVLNSGTDGGQTVDHLHIHVLGGRRMSWPPG